MFQALCESRIAGVNCLGSKARAGADFFPLFFSASQNLLPKASQAVVSHAPGSMSRAWTAPNLLEIIVSVTLVSSDCCPFCGILFRHLLSTWP